MSDFIFLEAFNIKFYSVSLVVAKCWGEAKGSAQLSDMSWDWLELVV